VLVPPEQLSQFTDRVLALLADPERLARMGGAARARVCREFTPQAECSALLHLYASLAS
jgi:glycosyltransferase involved in cell wall biosynthesis